MSDPGDPTTGFAQRVDAMLLARARSGDMQAFATLYACFGRACFNLALRLLGNRALADDLVQEVFLKLFAAIHGYRGEAPFGAWLKRMTVNAAIDQLRSQRHDSTVDAAALAEGQAAPDSAQAVAALDAWTLLQRLTPRARAVLVLHEFEGYTHSELAALFGQSESYSKSILARALKRLADLIDGAPKEASCPSRS